MNDFDRTQDELDRYLEKQFSTEQENKVEDIKNNEEDEKLNDYLQDTNEDTSEVDNQNTQANYSENISTNTVSDTDTVQLNKSDYETRLALERELAATKVRAEMFENAIRAGYESKFANEQNNKPNDVVYNDEDLAIDDASVSAYSEADQYIQYIARKVANDMYKRAVMPLQDQLQEVRGHLDRQKELNVQNQKFSLETQLKQVVPDLEDIANSNEWQSFIKQPAPFSGGTETIAHLVQRGVQSGNIRQIVEIVNDFKNRSLKGQPKQQHVSPGRSQVSQPVTKQPGKKMLNYSQFERATADFEAGRLSWDLYQKVADEFNTAFLEGRVNYNK